MLRAWIRRQVGSAVDDDGQRFRLQLVWVFCIMAAIVLIMTAVNLLTGKYEAIPATVLFGAVCLGCAAVLKQQPTWRRGPVIALMVAVLALFGYYIISGAPDGFSPIWICLAPPVALLLLGRWNGGRLCLLLFVEMVFLMWTPWGRGLLQYPYHETFLMRLPLVYVAAFGVCWFLEYVREMTQRQLQRARENYQHLYRHDALTGILNRHGFNEHIADTLQQENQEGLALMFIDMDDFKRINDRYGHPAGDRVLKALAETVSGLAGTDAVSRWGGEEFAVLLRRAEGAETLAEEIRRAATQMNVAADDDVIPVTVSIGLTVCPGGCAEAERLVTLTDQRLYHAKASGKNQVACCEYSEVE